MSPVLWVWLVALAVLWLLSLAAKRYRRRHRETDYKAEMEEYLRSITLQRRLADVLTPEQKDKIRQTGDAWEQDAPYPECFEEEQDDDL